MSVFLSKLFHELSCEERHPERSEGSHQLYSAMQRSVTFNRSFDTLRMTFQKPVLSKYDRPGLKRQPDWLICQ
jgi:hypothetical protein